MAASPPLNSKKKKLVEGQNNGEREDRISRLPDSMLHYILSFLPTKYAVGTSVLSTRWKYVWTSVPTLDFDDCLFFNTSLRRKGEDMSFMNFVDRVLFLHDVSNICKFTLQCSYAHDASRINAWISTLLIRKVQEIFLCIILEPYMLPFSFFTCKSLKILKIDSDSVVKIPTIINFPSLKILHLDFVIFSCDHSSHQVSFTCPILEEFNTQCYWMDIKTVNIFAPKLKTWRVDDYSYKGDNDLRDCEIKVYAESLITFDLTTSLSYEFSLYNLSSLVMASVDIVLSEEVGYRASKLLRGICNVKHLMLYGAAAMVFSRTDLSANLLPFSNLIHLEVDVGSPVDEGRDLGVRQLINILCHLPNIEAFHFTNGSQECGFEEHGWTLIGTTPDCTLSRLKSVKLEYFYGNQNELCLVNFLLKNARALEKMTILSSSLLSEDSKKQVEVTKQLLMFPRSSAFGLVDFK